MPPKGGPNTLPLPLAGEGKGGALLALEKIKGHRITYFIY